MSLLRALAGFAAVALLGALISPAQAQSDQPEVEEIELLFTHTAERGRLRPAGETNAFTLTLHDVADQVVWFSNHPARQTGHIPVRGFVRAWDGFGFGDDPPNAALTLLDGHRRRDTVILELEEPRYLRKTGDVRYSATMLGEATGNLDHLEDSRDARVPRRFRAASLFIDDANGQVINGCLIQPWAWCYGADLSGADLTWAILTNVTLSEAILSNAILSGATLSEADLYGADLSGANLSNVTLSEAILSNAILSGATLTWANLSGANLSGANLSGAILTNANLSAANLTNANLTNANLTNANLTNANLSGAYICRTIWTDGTENSRDC